MASETEISAFLNNFRTAAKSPNALILLRNYAGSKNHEGILALELTAREAKEEVFRLRVEDYSAGPEQDRDRPGQEVWIFAPIIAGREVYVKLVLTSDRRAKVLSFHLATYPMQCPFRKGKGGKNALPRM